MLPGVPWMKWALGEPRPGLGCWIGLASVPKPLAHHTLGTPACRERSLRSPQSLRSELELPDTLEASVYASRSYSSARLRVTCVSPSLAS